MSYVFTKMPSPMGELMLVASEKGLAAISWETSHANKRQLGEMARDDRNTLLQEVARQLTEYFAGTRKVFDVPLDPMGTEFQRSVWGQLVKIPFGVTWSYGQLAKSLGNAKAMRAVGAANGQNPIPLIVPCHRVIGSNGKLTGFAGGIERKDWLLRHEGARLL
jgi:methylated-DNA-[protein]-cysteine S-methyltransferase